MKPIILVTAHVSEEHLGEFSLLQRLGDALFKQLPKIRSSVTRLGVRVEYISAIEEAGGIPLIVSPSNSTVRDARELMKSVDGLLLTGGPHWPPQTYTDDLEVISSVRAEDCVSMDKYNADIALLREAEALKIPILGICAGQQLMAVNRGGKLENEFHNFEVHNGNLHVVSVIPGSNLNQMLDEEMLIVNSNHVQRVDLDSLTTCESLNPVAYSINDKTVEAVEDPTRDFYIGVQWHPERDRSEANRKLFASFTRACIRRRTSRSLVEQ